MKKLRDEIKLHRNTLPESLPNEYSVYHYGVFIGTVWKHRERTPEMGGRICIGHTERTVWRYKIAAKPRLSFQQSHTRERAVEDLIHDIARNKERWAK